MLPFTIGKDILLSLHPALCGFGATTIAGSGLTGLVDEFDVGAASVGTRIFSGTKCRGAAGEHLSDILNDHFTNMANVIIEERQPFLLSIEKGFEWFVWMHRQEDTCLCLCSLEKQRVSCLLHLLFLWYRNEHGGCRHLRNQQAIPPRSG